MGSKFSDGIFKILRRGINTPDFSGADTPDPGTPGFRSGCQSLSNRQSLFSSSPGALLDQVAKGFKLSQFAVPKMPQPQTQNTGFRVRPGSATIDKFKRQIFPKDQLTATRAPIDDTKVKKKVQILRPNSANPTKKQNVVVGKLDTSPLVICLPKVSMKGRRAKQLFGRQPILGINSDIKLAQKIHLKKIEDGKIATKSKGRLGRQNSTLEEDYFTVDEKTMELCGVTNAP